MSAPLETAAALLSARSGRDVRLESPALLKSWTRNDVWRARVADGPDLPASVIVKRFKSEPERGLDEWAALALLTAAGVAPAAAPGFLGGDAEARCFLVEDLGVAPTRASAPSRASSRSPGSPRGCTWRCAPTRRSSTGSAMRWSAGR